MPVPSSAQSFPYLFAPSDFQYNDALNADFTGIDAAIQNNTLWYPITQFGAVGDGVTDNTTAIQNAVNAAQSNRGVIYIPPGFFKITSQINISGGITVRGAGSSRSVVVMNNPTQQGFAVNTTAACNFYDFQITSNASPTAGSAIIFNPASSENGQSRVQNMEFVNLNNALAFIAASSWFVAYNVFTLITGPCIFVENTNNADSGDSVIMGNLMVNAVAGSAIGIQQLSSGGLKILGNKINGFNFGYLLEPNSAASVSGITIIEGNSFENCVTVAIDLTTNGSGSRQWSFVSITGNEIMVSGSSTAINVNSTAVSPSSTWIVGVTITGNNIVYNETGAGFGIIAGYSTGVTITGNFFEDINGSTAGNAILLTTGCNGATVTGNVTLQAGSTGVAINTSSATNVSVANNIFI